jgi:hypothetical protein
VSDVAVDIVVQFGALGLLGYMIIWLTKVGGPLLFHHLGAIESAIEHNSRRLQSLELSQSKLVDSVVERMKQACSNFNPK